MRFTKPLFRVKKLSEKLFYLLVIFIPLNLGKHFLIKEVYVKGVVSDYLVPTIYIQDIVGLFFIIFFIFEKFHEIKNNFRIAFNDRIFQVLIFFLFSVFLSTLQNGYLVYSYISFFRLMIYASVFVYLAYFSDRDVVEKSLKIMIAGGIFLSFLGIAQYFKQSSVFNNYLILGEQPYTFSTENIIKENVFGFSKIPSYGLFRHPNTFGGYLCLLLTLALGYFFCIKKFTSKRVLLLFSVICLITLFFTLSYVSMVVFLVGLIMLFFQNKLKETQIPMFIIFLILFVCFSLPFIADHTRLGDFESVYRRASLLDGAYSMIKEKFLFGFGFNEFTRNIENHVVLMRDLRFLQPVHNVFILIFSESGVFSFSFFLLFLLFLFKQFTEKLYLGAVILVQIIFLCSFDHYMFTQHQTLLVFFVTLGFLSGINRQKVDNRQNI